VLRADARSASGGRPRRRPRRPLFADTTVGDRPAGGRRDGRVSGERTFLGESTNRAGRRAGGRAGGRAGEPLCHAPTRQCERSPRHPPSFSCCCQRGVCAPWPRCVRWRGGRLRARRLLCAPGGGAPQRGGGDGSTAARAASVGGAGGGRWGGAAASSRLSICSGEMKEGHLQGFFLSTSAWAPWGLAERGGIGLYIQVDALLSHSGVKTVLAVCILRF